jgi:hypothetical protein
MPDRNPLRRKLTDTGAGLLIVALASSVAAILLFMPRRVPPHETPGLHLDPDEVAEVLERDVDLAGQAPDGELASEVLRLFGKHGEAEGAVREQGSARARAQDMRAAVARLRAVEGERSIAALRADALLRLPEMLLESDGTERRRFLGEFEETMVRYGLEVDGVRVAPPFVVRTLFMGRWNAVAGLPMTDGMSPIELQAYWGWLALESDAEPVRRLEALDLYEEAGGPRAVEARAVLSFLVGSPMRAAEGFDEAYEEGGSIRLRNHALAALEAAY